VKIDFDAKTIFGYDPQKRKLTPYMRGRLKVREIAAILRY